MSKRPVYQELANRILARKNCLEKDNTEWFEKHDYAISYIVYNHLPHGSGITAVYTDKTRCDRLVFDSDYHLMDENGMYDGWLHFTVTVKPDLVFGTNVSVYGHFSQRGGKYSHLKDYLADIFHDALNETIDIRKVAREAEAG